MTRSEKVVRLDDVAPITWASGEAGRFLLRAADTGGDYSFYQVVLPPGEGSVLHLHEAMDETFYVTAGEFRITVGGVEHAAPAGVLVHGPRGVAHSFRNATDRPATMLCITTPGGIEEFFEQLAELTSRRPPAGGEELRALAARHRIVTFAAAEPAAAGR